MKRRRLHRLAFAGLMMGTFAWLHAGPLPPKKPARQASPPYTVVIAYQERSPFVPDGRMTFADLAFSASFKDVVFVWDPSAPLASCSIKSGTKGTVFLTRHVFNDVEGGCERHKPWVKEEWPIEHPARLLVAMRQFLPIDTNDPDTVPIVPIPPNTPPEKVTLKFWADFGFGVSGLMFYSKLGSAVLSSMLYEFDVPWRRLLEGKPFSLEVPQELEDIQGKADWWIEFLPPKK